MVRIILISFLLCSSLMGQTHTYPATDTANVFINTNQFILGVQVGPKTFSTLPAEVNGTLIYCSDCQVTNPCISGGTGAIASGINGAWNCGGSNGGGVSGSGTTGTVPWWTNGPGSVLGDSPLSFSGCCGIVLPNNVQSFTSGINGFQFNTSQTVEFIGAQPFNPDFGFKSIGSFVIISLDPNAHGMYFYIGTVNFAALASPPPTENTTAARAAIWCLDCKGPQDSATWGSVAAGSGTGSLIIYDGTNWRVH